MKQKLFEGFAPSELKGFIHPNISIDEFSAKSGENDDVVTLAFFTKSKVAGQDLSDWFSTGYDWVIDSEVSEGELERQKFVVFVELDRRFRVPDHIIELVEDLETLTELSVDDWVVEIEGDEYPLDIRVLKEMMPLSPHEYRLIHPEEKEEKTTKDPEDSDESNLPPMEEPEEELPAEAPPEAAPQPGQVPGQVPPPPQPGQVPGQVPPPPQPGQVPGQVPPPPQPGQQPGLALQEMRNIANLSAPKSSKKVDKELREWLNKAGL